MRLAHSALLFPLLRPRLRAFFMCIYLLISFSRYLLVVVALPLSYQFVSGIGVGFTLQLLLYRSKPEQSLLYQLFQ